MKKQRVLGKTYNKKAAAAQMKAIEKAYGKDYGTEDPTDLLKLLKRNGYYSLIELFKLESAPQKITRNAKNYSNNLT